MKYKILLFALILTVVGCKKYLEEKSDKTTSSIETASDVLLLLNNESQYLNACLALAGSDDYYFPDKEYKSMSEKNRSAYIWNDRLLNYTDYLRLYGRIFYANTILSNVPSIKVSSEQQRNELKGMALFHRGLASLQAAEVYALHYKAGSPGDGPGIVLRLNEDQNVPVVRYSLADSYRQIGMDLEIAAPLLPVNVQYKNLPNRAAGYALLARFYLQTEQYAKAEIAATSCLNLQSQLLDFNTLTNASFPLGNYVANPEILYYQIAMETLSVALSNRPRADTLLRAMYAPGDLRSTYYFRSLPDGTETFKNSYSGIFRPFTGIATDEVYLIRAECYAREGKTAEAMEDLNTLLRARWTPDAFVPASADNPADALSIVLRERRKELVMRGLRWSDIKRLNNNAATAVTLLRRIEGKDYTLPPNDLRFAWLLPAEVIHNSGVPQNPR